MASVVVPVDALVTVDDADDVPLVAHHAAHRRGRRRARGPRALRVRGVAAAPRHADVHVDEALAEAGRGRGRDRGVGVDRDRDAGIELGHGAQAVGVDDLVGQQQVLAEAGRAMPITSRGVAQVKPVVTDVVLSSRQRRALVGLDVRAAAGARERRSHRVEVRVEATAVDDERRRREVAHSRRPRARLARSSATHRLHACEHGMRCRHLRRPVHPPTATGTPTSCRRRRSATS